MVNYGMSPTDAIISATKNTAKLLDIYKEVGSIEVGKDADFVALTKDPLIDIQNIKATVFIMKEGKEILL